MKLFEPFEIQGLRLQNRIVMAPMTRSRVDDDGILTSLNAEYYAQRAQGGLIVSEAIVVDPVGRGYLLTPGLYTAEQVNGAALVANAVHAKGGRIFAQLWHVGRVAHISTLPTGAIPVSPTAEPLNDTFVFGRDDQGRLGKVRCTPPRALTDDEVGLIIEQFSTAAANAIEAGFDGVEILAANGYLFDQFQNSVVNTRSGYFGGATADSRINLLRDTITAIQNKVGSVRIGVRLSPFGTFNGVPKDPKTAETYLELASALEKLGVCYVHFNDEPVSIGHLNQEQVSNTVSSAENQFVRLIPSEFLREFRNRFKGAVIICGGLTFELAEKMQKSDQADLFAFGIPFIANPDLPARLQNHWPLAKPDLETFYGGGAKGYIDYPAFSPA
ncbi:alkene reductase [Pseudomonas sp. BGr12]|uniref:alkene reductase n=1 Tax=Pseudomonas sp. BGr12 TaxID=2936269 RepID=UPI002559E5A6|nr:alkene reductase [Pseudomonas sp. BJa5]MDL2428440.1 alkene reductase [Pseudomonas sp. BJa5]